MSAGGFHMNVNVLDRAVLEDAMEHPEKYPELTIRVGPDHGTGIGHRPDPLLGPVHRRGRSRDPVRPLRQRLPPALPLLRQPRHLAHARRPGGHRRRGDGGDRQVPPFSHHRRRGRDLTGGEPLLQPAFTAAVLRRCKEAALHTALDTSGFLGARASDALLADTDLVLLDVKSFDVPMYRKLTGGALAPTVNFATRLDRLGRRVWIRYVLVPGWTDDEDAVDGLAAFLSGLACVERVDILPFHKLGAAKYDALGVPFPLRDTPVPDRTLVDRVRVRFREHGLMAH